MTNKKRILKPLSQRKPEELLHWPELINQVVQETKYRRDDVKIVLDCMLDKMAEALRNKKSTRLPKIGTIFPTIKRSRVGMSLNGGVGKPERIIVPDRWMARFQPSRDLKNSLFELTVSEKELDSLYKN